MDALFAALDPVVDALDRVGSAWYVCGSVASTAHGESRTTRDVDIVASLSLEAAEPFARLLEQDYYADVEMIRDAILHRSSFNLLHLATMFKVDVFAPKQRPYDSVAFERRQRRPLVGMQERTYFVSAPEDVVLAKLEWFRLGGEVSDQQWRDVLGVLKLQGDAIDVDYMRRWAIELAIADLLQRALEDAGLT